jgi:phosphonate transport system ATP-binding protein
MTKILEKSDTLLSIDREDISYADFVALKDISLSIREGDKVAIIGQSGAGKTTLLRRLFHLNPEKCAFVHQHHVLVPQLTTFHNIYMGRLERNSVFANLRNLVKPSASAVEKIRPIVSKLGLEDKLFSRVGELSGGQQQRVGIGRAIYQGGAVVLADEPVSSLDVMQQEEIMEHLVSAGRTVVSALHSVSLSRRFFDRIVGLKDRAVLFDLPSKRVNDRLLTELYG